MIRHQRTRAGVGSTQGIPTQPPNMPAGQYQQYLAWLRSHTFTPFQRAAYNKQKLASSAARRNAVQAKRVAQLAAPACAMAVSSATAPVSPEGMPASAGEWIAGGNDRHRGCAAVAAANSLLACTGERMPDDIILGLYLAASGGRDEGASVASVLSVLEDAGAATGERLEDGEPLGEDGLILDLDLTTAQQSQETWDWAPALAWGPHAVTFAPGGPPAPGDLVPRQPRASGPRSMVITWGWPVPVTVAFLEHQVAAAWRVHWG